MLFSTYLIRFKRLFVLGAVVCVAGAIASTAAAVGRPPDVQDAASANVATLAGRPPDISDVASRMTALSDVFERYAAAHPYGVGTASTTVSVPRPPDVSDTALALQYRPAAEPSGFGWTDWSIGIGTGIGLALFVGAGLVVTRRQLRHQTQTA